MKPNNLFLLQIGVFLHSGSAAFSMITKDLLFRNKSDKTVYSNYNLIKKTSAILASFLGQDLLFYSGCFDPLMIITLFNCIITLILSFFVPKSEKIHMNSVTGSFTDIFQVIFRPKADLNQNIKISKLFNWNFDCVFYILSYIIASLVYISFSFYSSTIFIENKEEITRISLHFSNIIKLFLKPVRLVSILIVKFIKIFYKFEKEEQSDILHGYIDGIARLIAILFSYIVVGLIQFNHMSILVILFICMVLTYLMGSVKSLVSVYLIYIANIAFSNLLLVYSVNNFKFIPHIGILFGIIFIFCDFVHLGVTYLSSRRIAKVYLKNKERKDRTVEKDDFKEDLTKAEQQQVQNISKMAFSGKNSKNDEEIQNCEDKTGTSSEITNKENNSNQKSSENLTNKSKSQEMSTQVDMKNKRFACKYRMLNYLIIYGVLYVCMIGFWCAGYHTK